MLAVLLVAAACQPAAAPTPDIESPVVGVVVDVDSAGLTDVHAFALRTNGGRTFELRLGPLENATEFPPGHLGEHLASSEPIRVWFNAESGDLVAYRIEDAGD